MLRETVDRELFDCRAVHCFQRAACNRRVLAALNQIKTTASEVRGYQASELTYSHISIQLERQERLRSFVAPECRRPPTSACGRLSSVLANACRAVDRFFEDAAARPKFSTSPGWALPDFLPKARITLDDEGMQWLHGRWEGWINFSDSTSVRTSLRINVNMTDKTSGTVKACSDQGMVSGRVEAGMLELSRREAWLFGSRMLLWRSPPHFDDLDGVLLLETVPGREMQHGLVWLSRALSIPDYHFKNLTDYPCQDKELLDGRQDRELSDLRNKVRVPNQ